MTPLAAAAEALLFVCDEPLSTLALADALSVTPEEAQEALTELGESLTVTESGIRLEALAGGWRLLTHAAYHDVVEAFVASWDRRRLSKPALEVLAIVAYAQPVTRSELSDMRGVSSDSALQSLVEKKLVTIVGAADAPGTPALYGTTRTFLESFGLNALDDLPPLEDYAPSEAVRQLIIERLSARGVRETLSDALTNADEDEVGQRGRSLLSQSESDSNADDAPRPSLEAAEIEVDLSGYSFNFDDE